MLTPDPTPLRMADQRALGLDGDDSATVAIARQIEAGTHPDFENSAPQVPQQGTAPAGKSDAFQWCHDQVVQPAFERHPPARPGSVDVLQRSQQEPPELVHRVDVDLLVR